MSGPPGLFEILPDFTRVPIASGTGDAVDVSYFVPCFNEARNVTGTIEKLVEVSRRLNLTYEILVIADGSTDGQKRRIRRGLDLQDGRRAPAGIPVWTAASGTRIENQLRRDGRLSRAAVAVNNNPYVVRSECSCCAARFLQLFRCSDCGILYCRHFYAQHQLQLLYGRQSENMADLPLEARRCTHRGYARSLMQHSRGQGGFLEVGADIGLFARCCAELGQFDRLWLYEPNANMHRELANHLLAYTHTVHPTMALTDDVPRASVSTAALVHVLDHLLEPGAGLAIAGVSRFLPRGNGPVVPIRLGNMAVIARRPTHP